jgi:hypothetical protein
MRVEHRPRGIDWYRWIIYENRTGRELGVVCMDETQGETMPSPEIKVLLRRQALSLMLQAA